MKYLVAGCAGFLGSSVAESLLYAGHEVIGLDSFTADYSLQIKRRNLEVSRSYRTFKLVEMPLSELAHTEVIDGTAALIHLVREDPSSSSDFQNYLSKLSTSLKRVILGSSYSVYGESNNSNLPSNPKLREDSHLSPHTEEGKRKAEQERALLSYANAHNVEVTLLRYFTIYGPRQRPDMGIHQLIRAGFSGEEFTLRGGLKHARDYLFIDDAVDATLKALQSEPGVYNIGSGRAVSLREIIFNVENIIGRKIRTSLSEDVNAPMHVQADISRAAEILAYQPKVSLDQGLEAEARWIDQMLREGVL